VPNEPVTRGYVVGPGEGVPDRGPEVKASGRSTGGSLTLIKVAIDGGPPRQRSRSSGLGYVEDFADLVTALRAHGRPPAGAWSAGSMAAAAAASAARGTPGTDA
jgi:hypothetical protein